MSNSLTQRRYEEHIKSYLLQLNSVESIYEKQNNAMQKDEIQEDEDARAEHSLILSNIATHMASLHIGLYNIGFYYFERKADQNHLEQARKFCNKGLRLLEDVYGDSLQSTISENLENIARVSIIPEEQRYKDVLRLGFIIDYLNICVPDVSRWVTLILSFKSRLTVILRNSIELRKINDVIGADNTEARIRRNYLHLVLSHLEQSAEENRRNYEISRQKSEMERAIDFCLSLAEIQLILQKREVSTEFKKRAETWAKKLEADSSQH